MSLVHVQDAAEIARARSNEKCLIKFGANWCPPCRRVEEVLEKLALENEGNINFYSVDIDEFQGEAARAHVSSIPHFEVWAGGKLLEYFVGTEEVVNATTFLSDYTYKKIEASEEEKDVKAQ